MSDLLILIIIVLAVLLLIFIVGAIFIVKAVSMYKQSEKDKKYDEMLKQPLEKMGGSNLSDLEQKYNTNKEME